MSEVARLPSPCTGICEIDGRHGLCRGCARSTSEIASWRDYDGMSQWAVWRDLPRRRRAMSLPFHLLPWTGRPLFEHLAELTALPGSLWTMGVPGALALLAGGHTGGLKVRLDDHELNVQAAEGQMRLRHPAGLRAFELIHDRQPPRLVLALHRARLQAPAPATVTPLGPDREAARPEDTSEDLVDLGLGLRNCRFCIRAGDGLLLEACRHAAGTRWTDGSTGLLKLLLHASPTRVVTTPVGRIEVTSRIGQPDTGARTHLLPHLQDATRELEPGYMLPPDYVACATLHSDG